MMDAQKRITPIPVTRRAEERPLPKVGQCIAWNTIGGDRREGVVSELDGNVVVVQCTDGKERCIEW